MAIKQEYIETVLGAVCNKLGYAVSNAALYREVVPVEVTDEQLEAECEKFIEEQKELQTTSKPRSIEEIAKQIADLQTQLAKLSA